MSIGKFKERLREARTKAGLKQSELSEMSNVTAATISAYECSDGKKGQNPSLENAARLAKALNVSIDWLYGLETTSDGERDYLKIGKMLLDLFESRDIVTVTGKARLDGFFGNETVLAFADPFETYLNFFREFQKIKEIENTGIATKEMVETLKKNALYKFAEKATNDDNDLPF